MKTAIASKGKTEDSEISEIGGRAPYYLVFENKKLVKVLPNHFKFGGGAGYAVAKMLINEKVDLVISGRFGAVLSGVLEDNKIKTKVAAGKVKEVL